jgi:16S rRNA processing protein RimM
VRRFEDLVAIGRVVKPQGRKGELAVEPLSDRPDRFPGLKRAFLAGPGGAAREVRVAGCWPHKGRFVLKLEGVDSIDQAEGLRGLELRVPEQELAALPAGSYYHHQLKGLAVEDAEGRELGRVSDILTTGAGADVLVVQGASGESLIPLAEHFVLAVELERGRIVVRLPEYVDAGR